MLDRHKLLSQLDQINKDLFCNFAKDRDVAVSIWNSIKDKEWLSDDIHKRKYSLLMPAWQGSLGYSKKIDEKIDEYGVLATDGSQIYYDKHQGPGCYLINIGSIVLNYSKPKSSVSLSSQPHVFFLSGQNREHGSADFINLQREEYEFQRAWELSFEFKANYAQKPFLTLIDGSLIFFHLENQGNDQKLFFLDRYFNYLQKFCDENLLIAGYISFPQNKELVHVLKLVASQFDEHLLQDFELFDQLTDVHVAQFFLQSGYRSTIFQSKAPISYLYPKLLKPYFCYLHVGHEIVRVEFPAWIAQDEKLVDEVCRIAYDQASKGRGYPVCLFEAHEQAVVKGYDRDFFYAMLQRKTEQYGSSNYQRSLKSLKKMRVDM